MATRHPPGGPHGMYTDGASRLRHQLPRSPITSSFCDVCQVTVTGYIEAHNYGKKHLSNMKKDTKPGMDDACVVFVRGYHPSTTNRDLEIVFSNYGKIVKIRMFVATGVYAFIEFGTAVEARAALQAQGRKYRGWKLNVKAKEARKAPDTLIVVTPVNYNDVGEQLRAAGSVQAQMVKLRELLMLTPTDVKAREKIVERLNALFQRRLPECCVRPFGSSVTGFGVTGCDLDLFLDLNRDLSQPPAPNQPPVMLRISDSGPILEAAVAQASLGQLLNYVEKVVRRSSLKLTSIHKIPASRCPVLKFFYVDSGMSCDLSINNRLALRNTELLEFLCCIEPRLQTLMFTLRYFFKSCGITDGVSGSQKLSNYALSWLAITYMQQCDPPLLPSIVRLRELAADSEHTVTDTWDTTFTQDASVWHANSDCSPPQSDEQQTPASEHPVHIQPPSARDVAVGGPLTLPNNMQADELLTGFFAFYNGLNLKTSVVCPRVGRVLSIDEFRAMNDTQPRQEEFKLNIVNIQDPFVLSHNIAQNLNDNLGEQLVAEIKEGDAKCACVQFTTQGKDHDWGVTFLTSKERLIKGPLSSSERSQALSGTCNYCMYLEFLAASVPSNIFKQIGSVTKLEVQWVQNVCRLLRETLTDTLFFTCDVTIDQLSSIEDNVNESVTLHARKRLSSNRWPDEPSEKKVYTGIQRESSLELENITSAETNVDNANFTGKTELSTCTEISAEREVKGCDQQKIDMETIHVEKKATDDFHKNMCTETSDHGENMTNMMEESTCIDATKAVHVDESACVTKETPKDSPKKTLLLAFSVQAKQMTWAGRKRIKKEMRKNGKGVMDTLNGEKVVAKQVQLELGPIAPSAHPIMGFDVEVFRTTMPNGKLGVNIQMAPTLAPKMFVSFYQFFKVYFLKLKENSLFGFL